MSSTKPANHLDPENYLDPYRFDADSLLTPALAIYPDAVRNNIAQILRLLSGRPERWRPHLKTVKLGSMMKLLVEAGVTSAKCATTLELLVACQAGIRDVLVAYPHTGQNARRVAEIARQHPGVRVSILIEAQEQIRFWTGTAVSVFIDINTGMNRTGMNHDSARSIARLASATQAAGLEFRGVHFYDGHATETDLEQRTEHAHARYDDLLRIVSELGANGTPAREVITAGTPAFPCSLSYPGLWNSSFDCQVSPGTVVYNDISSLGQLPEEYGLRPAVLVISRVVSHPKTGLVTCDAGHKSLSVDSGVPNCEVLGNIGLTPLKPSEEHLPLEVTKRGQAPPIGETLYLLPRHVCPTVNNFDYAVTVENGQIAGMEPVGARGREAPIMHATAST